MDVGNRVYARCFKGLLTRSTLLLVLGLLLLPAKSYAQTITISAPSFDYDGSFTVSWVVNPGSGYNGYTVLMQRFNGGSWTNPTFGSKPLGSQSHAVTGAQEGTYEYRVDYGYCLPSQSGCPMTTGSTNTVTTVVIFITPPVISGVDNVANYTENGSAVTIDSTVTITDSDSANLNQATVSLTTNFASSEDSLVYSTINGISGSYNSGTGVLTLSGTATKADYEGALETVKYLNSSNTPSTATRTISFVVRDTDNNSSSADTTTLTVTAVNDLPVLSGVDNVLSYTENNAATVIDSSVTITDADNSNMNQATVSITTNFASAEDSLVYSTINGISGSYNSGTGVLTLSGTTTKANYEGALETVKYQNSSNNPSTATRTISFVVRDSDNGSSTADTTTLTITAVNDAPVISGVDNVVSYDENDAATVIDSTITVTDADNSNLNQATVSLTTNFASSEDSLVYSTINGITGSYNSGTGVLTLSGTATKADYEGALETVKYQNSSESPSAATRTISFVVRDTNNTNSAADTTTLTVTAVHDAPVLSDVNNVAGFVEGLGSVVIDPTITITDSDSTNMVSATVVITTNHTTTDILEYSTIHGISGSFSPYTGTSPPILTLSGTATKAQYEEALESVRFDNSSSSPSTATRTILFAVSDSSGGSNAPTTTLTVTDSSPPSVSAVDNVANYTENGSAVTIDSTVTITDSDSANLNQAWVSLTTNFQSSEDSLLYSTVNGITGSYNSGTGVLTLSGTATKAQYEQALESVQYQNSSDDPSTSTRTLSFVVRDTTNLTGGDTTTLTVSAVNDVPVLSGVDNVLSYTENDAATVIDSSVTITDIDNGNMNQATVSITTNFASAEDSLVYSTINGITGSYNSGSGVLTLSGTTTKANYEGALETVKYQNSSNNPSTATRTVSFVVRDSDNGSSTADTTTITITAANDAPVIADVANVANYTENGSAVTIDSAVTITDADSANLNQATVSITTNFASSEDSLVYSTINGITGSYNSGNGVLTLSGTATKANYEGALETVKYQNSSDSPSTATRTISFVVRDTNNASSSADTTTLTVTAVNDAPVISGVDNVPNFVINAGSVVIDPSITIADVDHANIASAAVVITTNSEASDSLVYSTIHGITASYPSGSDVLILSGVATKAQYEEALESVRFDNSSSTPSAATRTILFQVWDTADVGSNQSTTTLTVTPNNAPVISGVANVSNFSENPGTAVVIDSSITITDSDNSNLNQATVSITENFTSDEDLLVYSTVNGITGSYNSSTGVLTLSGTASKADYEEALETVKYDIDNSVDDPNPNTRTISFVVRDSGNLSSAPDTTMVTFTPDNEIPVISGVDNVASYTENASPVFIDTAVTITDADNANLNRATILIWDNYDSGADVLLYETMHGITGHYNSTIGMLTLSGVATKAHYEEALESVKYQNISEDPSTATRSLAFRVRDTTNTGSDDDSTTLTVTAVNDAPVLSDVDNIATYTVGASEIVIDSGVTIADDSDIMNQATVSITTNFASSEDSLVYTTVNGITGSYNSGTGVLTLSGTATQAQYEQALESVKYLNSSGAPSMGTRTLSFVVRDSDNLSSAADTTTLRVTAIPVISGVDNVASFTEDGSAVTIDSSVTISDAGGTNLNQATVSITNNYSAQDQLLYTTVNGITGSYSGNILTLSGIATLAQYEQALESVQFQNVSDMPSTATRTLSFVVRNTDNTSSAADTTTLTVASANDAPVISGVDTVATFSAGQAESVIDASITISDGDSTQLNQATVAITANLASSEDELIYSTVNGITGSYNSGTGVLTLSGTATLAQYEQALESVKYWNSSGTPSTSPRTVSFVVRDTSNTTSAADTTTVTLHSLIVPDEFQHELDDASFLPYLGAGEFVGITEGSISVNQGVANYSLPITLPPAIGDLKPGLALNYNSNSGNGLAGVGWSLMGLSVIARCPPTYATEGSEAQDSNPRYTNADRLCMDGQKLEIASASTPANDSTYWAQGAEYRTETDTFARIKAVGTLNGAHEYFEVHTKGGLILTFGADDDSQDSRIYATKQGSGGPVSVWALDKVEDRYGNAYTVHYEQNNAHGDYYPTHILFEPDASVVFTYEDRDNDDMPWGYDKGNLRKHPKLLRYITTYVDSDKVRQYELLYTIRSATTDRYLVNQIQECGFDDDIRVCAKPLTFEWQAGELGFDTASSTLPFGTSELQVADIDNDGYDDLFSGQYLYWGGANGFTQAGSWATAGWEDWETKTLIGTPAGRAFLVTKEDSNSTETPKEQFIGIVKLDRANSTATYSQIGSNSVDPTTVVATDLNNDGREDFLFGEKAWLQQNTASVSFAPAISNAEFYSTYGVCTPVEYNSDGLIDLFVHLHNPIDPEEEEVQYSYTNIMARANTGNGRFSVDSTNVSLPVSDAVVHEIATDSCASPAYFPGSMAYNLLDVNGDGNQDYAYHRKSGGSNGTWYVGLNTGDGFSRAVNTGKTSGTRNNQYSYAYDWNKDSRQDLIVTNTSYNGWRVLVSSYDNGGFAFQELSTDPFNGNMGNLAGLDFVNPQGNILRGDFNNDGLIDVVIGSYIWYAKRQQPDLLKAVSNGFGAEIELEYSPLVGDLNNGQPLYTPSSQKPVFPQRHAHRGMQVVKKISTSDGLGGWRHRYFNYTGAKEDVQGRGFLGFEKIVETDTSKDTVSTVNYRQDYPFIGQVASAEVKDINGNLISITDNGYAIHGTNTRFPVPEYSIERRYGLTTTSAGSPLSVTKVENTYDAYGTLTDQTTRVGTGLSGTTVTGLKRVTVLDNTTITNNTTDWLLGFIEESVVSTSVDGNNGMRTVTTQFDPQVSPNTLDVEERRDFVGTAVEKTTNTIRGSNGVITGTTAVAKDLGSVNTAVRSVTYDFTGAVGPIYPNNRENSLGHITELGYDTRFGVVNSETDPNGLTVTREYDLLARLKTMTAPDDTVTRIIRYECATAPVSCPSAAVYLVATEVTNPNASGKLGAPLRIVYYDMLQREVRQESYSLNGTVIKVDTQYYADGRVKRVSEPFTATTPANWNTIESYDALSRPLEITGADGGSIEYVYSRQNGLAKTVETVSVLNPYGTRVTTRYSNALGQVTQVIDAVGTPVDYEYDSQGNLTKTRVDSNAATDVIIVHDVAGNKTSMTDPDAGNIDFEYNGFGELRRQTWDGTDDKTMTFTYDVLGRKTDRTDDLVVGSNVSYTWTWDTVKDGLLTSQSGNGITETYAYDSLSRPQSLTTAITGLSGSRVFEYTYDAFSRPETIEYPDGLMVEHQYHAIGMQVQTRDITTSSNPKILWTIGKDSDARGNLTQHRFGNGVITLSTFDATSGRIEAIKTGWPTAAGLTGFVGNIQDLSYDFDTLGNLYERTTGRTNLSGTPQEDIIEIFEYDALNRLIASDTNWDPSPPNARARDYTYDDLGNLTSKTGIGTLTYGESANNGGVHAVTSANGKEYHYDDYGNLIKRGTAASGYEELEYDVFNKPTRIGDLKFSYGPDHHRFKQDQSDGDRIVYYINGGQYEEIVEGSTVTQRSHVGGYLVRSTVSSTTTLTYLHKDHIGSTEAMTDASGNMISTGRMSFDPWGNRQNSDWSDGNPPAGDPDYYPTTRGFSGHEMLDQVNLIHMNGRVYDPVIGRFLTADIFVQAPHNSQSFNRYSYVLNNPLSLVDPTGYCSAAIEGGNFAAMLSRQFAESTSFKYEGVPLLAQDAHLEGEQKQDPSDVEDPAGGGAETETKTKTETGDEGQSTPASETMDSVDESGSDTVGGGTPAGSRTDAPGAQAGGAPAQGANAPAQGEANVPDQGAGTQGVTTNQEASAPAITGELRLVADRATGTLQLVDSGDNVIQTYLVGNNTTNPKGDPNTVGSNAPSPAGTFPVQNPVDTTGDAKRFGSAFFPIGAVGANGQRLDIARQRGIGLHAGRAGPQSKTYGCLRVSEATIQSLVQYHNANPITSITIR